MQKKLISIHAVYEIKKYFYYQNVMKVFCPSIFNFQF